MTRLSLVIPSFHDPLSMKTIQSALDASDLGDGLEVVCCFDGYWPDWPLVSDPRVRYVHLGSNRGMREAINAGVAVSRGEFIARSDEHCCFGPAFDRLLTEACQPNWIITARRYARDPVKWEVMESVPFVDYERLAVQTIGTPDGGTVKKWVGMPWRREGRDHLLIDETQAFQGSFWVMPRAWWESTVGPLRSDLFGSHYQDSHEMCFKTWAAGGRVMVHKGVWFAHKHVSFPRTHTLSHGTQTAELQYAYDRWNEDYRRLKARWREEAAACCP